MQLINNAKEATEVAMGLRKPKGVEAALAAKKRRQEREEKKKKKQLIKALHDDDDGGSGKAIKAGVNDHELLITTLTMEELEKVIENRRIEQEKRALEKLRLKAEREKAWFMAHPHKFIRPPGETAFCIVCKEKNYEFWLKTYNDEEARWKKGLDVLIGKLFCTCIY